MPCMIVDTMTRSESALRQAEFGHRRGLERVEERRDAGDVLVNVSTRERILVQDESSYYGRRLADPFTHVTQRDRSNATR